VHYVAFAAAHKHPRPRLSALASLPRCAVCSPPAEGSVNAVAWGPREYGLRLACASSDENVSVLTHHGEGQWSSVMLESKEGKRAHKTGANAVSWAPPALGLRLVTGGCDNRIKIWACGEDGITWHEEAELGVYGGRSVHTDWVRDVAWAPAVGGVGGMIASCAQDKKVVVWTESNGQWTPKEILMPCAVWSVSWSVTGSILAAAGGDNQVTLWKENAVGEWKQIGQLSEDSQAEPAS
jgi:protein transport protein SEC13